MLSDTKLLMQQFTLEWNRNSREFRGAYLPIWNDENRHLGTPFPHWENLDMLKALFYSPTLCFNYSKCKWMMIKLKTRLWTMCSFSSAKFWPLKTCQRNCAKRVNSMTWSEDVFGVNHFIVYILYFYINEQRMNILMYIHYIIYIYFSWYTDKTFINYKLLVCLEHEHHWLGCSVGW